MTAQEYKDYWLEKILTKLRSEHAKDLTDAELTRCLGGCISAPELIELAKDYRHKGWMTMYDLVED